MKLFESTSTGSILQAVGERANARGFRHATLAGVVRAGAGVPDKHFHPFTLHVSIK